MTVTIENYFEKNQVVLDAINTSGRLLAAHDFLVRATNGGENLDNYYNNASIKETIDLYFEKLNAIINIDDTTTTEEDNGIRVTVTKKKTVPSRSGYIDPEVDKEQKPKNQPATTKKVPKRKATDQEATYVERMPEEIRFIKRFVNLHEKVKEKEDILRFINALQKAILEKRIRKTSIYAEQILYMQDGLITLYKSMKGRMTMKLKPEVYEVMKKIVGGEKIIPAINFIKRYIGMNGKPGMKDKARILLRQIDGAYEKEKIKNGDPYTKELMQLRTNLWEFISANDIPTLDIEKATLNGLQGILSGCNCGPSSLSGVDELPEVMNSMDFANMQFKTLGLKGKWRELIGDPSANFTAMVFGKPKMGKSYLCVDFAGYLARHHGKVLYVAKEEGLDKTLQQKLDDKAVKHPNLFVASQLPGSLNDYDFIFLDSVNRLGLTPEDLQRLKASNPSKSFIYVFQSTKQGSFRGEQAFQHDVDIVMEVPEKGKVVQMGRYNQGGEMDIFEDLA